MKERNEGKKGDTCTFVSSQTKVDKAPALLGSAISDSQSHDIVEAAQEAYNMLEDARKIDSEQDNVEENMPELVTRRKKRHTDAPTETASTTKMRKKNECNEFGVVDRLEGKSNAKRAEEAANFQGYVEPVIVANPTIADVIICEDNHHWKSVGNTPILNLKFIAFKNRDYGDFELQIVKYYSERSDRVRRPPTSHVGVFKLVRMAVSHFR
ncbi:hypothetical protein LguiB_036312 [Lonicera macranthoides]